MRGRFAWLGAGVVLLAVGAGATVGTQDTWLDGYGIVAYFLVPLAFIPFAAVAIASPRANRFVESVFTTPVTRRDWFVAKVLVLFTLAVAYYLALVPMMFVYVAHVGVPLLLKEIPALDTGSAHRSHLRGRACRRAVHRSQHRRTDGDRDGFRPHVRRICAAAGAHGCSRQRINARGHRHAGEVLPCSSRTHSASRWLSEVSPPPRGSPGSAFFVIAVGALVLATWVFLSLQGVETWEATTRQRWILTLSLVAIAAFPVVFADRNYELSAPPVSNAPPIRALFARGSGSIAMASPGGAVPARCCNTILNRDTAPIGIDESTHRDLFILLPVDANQPLSDLRIEVSGDAGLRVLVDSTAMAQASERLETHAYPSDSGPTGADGHRINAGWVVRLPVTLYPTRPWDVGGVRYPLDVKVTYRPAGSTQPQTLTSRAAVEAEVSSAVYEMSGASAILPAICFCAAFVRWRRTR